MNLIKFPTQHANDNKPIQIRTELFAALDSFHAKHGIWLLRKDKMWLQSFQALKDFLWFVKFKMKCRELRVPTLRVLE